MESIYWFVSSTDSTDIHPRNNSYDFTVELPKLYNFSGSTHKIGLTEIGWDKNKGNQNNDLYVYCDVIGNNSCSLGTNEPILRVVKKPKTFSGVYYMEVAQDFISSVRIYIKGKNKLTPQFDIGRVTCTLEIKGI